jgi:hypothetical protein
MTLIVGRRSEKSVRFCGDSKITDLEAIRGNYLTGALKVIVLDDDLCVAISGGIETALRAIRDLDARRNAALPEHLSRGDAAEHLRGTAVASGGRVGFLIGARQPQRLLRIRMTGVEEHDNLWIGDQDAFEAYQRHRHEPSWPAVRLSAPTEDLGEQFAEMAKQSRASEPERLKQLELPDETIDDFLAWGDMTRAMQDVIADPTVSSVGEIWIGAVGDRQGFRYLLRVQQTGGTPLPGDDRSVKAPFSAAEGGFGYAVLVPKPGVGAVGIYFPQGRVGALFYPLAADRAIPYTNMKQEDFTASVLRDYGVVLEGGFGPDVESTTDLNIWVTSGTTSRLARPRGPVPDATSQRREAVSRCRRRAR